MHVTYVNRSDGRRQYYRVMADGTKRIISKEDYDRAKKQDRRETKRVSFTSRRFR